MVSTERDAGCVTRVLWDGQSVAIWFLTRAEYDITLWHGVHPPFNPKRTLHLLVTQHANPAVVIKPYRLPELIAKMEAMVRDRKEEAARA
jgi:hypothetical protein